MQAEARHAVKASTLYRFECFDKDGRLKWVEEARNIVVNEGLDDILNKHLKGSSYTAAWYAGLVDNTGYTAIAAADTAAKITTTANPPTTNGWQEATGYTGDRQTLTLGTVSGQSVDNSASKAVFPITGTLTLKGGFVVSTNTKGGTSGVLYGVVAFTGGNRSVVSGDTINLTTTFTQAAA